MQTDRALRPLLALIAVLLAVHLAVDLVRTFSPPAMAQESQGSPPHVVAIAMDQKYLYRAWSNGNVEAVYCRWVGEQDPATTPNQWVNATPKNLK